MATAGPYPDPNREAFRRRRSRVRGFLLTLGLVFVGAGAIILVLAATPRTFGLRGAPSFPLDGGLLAIFLILWGSMMLVRAALVGARMNRWAGGPPPGRRFDPAILAARERYARGEISREQFQQVVQDLRRPPPGPLP